MSDPLSIYASIVGLIAFEQKFNQFCESHENLPNSVHEIQHNVNQISAILRQIQAVMYGSERPASKHLLMISLHDMLTLLTGCVLVYSSIDRELGLQSLRDKNFLTRAMESEMAEILTDLQRFKMSFRLMLEIIQMYKRDKLNDVDVDAKITEPRGLLGGKIGKMGTEYSEDQEPSHAETIDGINKRTDLAGDSAINDFDDRASIRTTKMSFADELESSIAYRRYRSGRVMRLVDRSEDSSDQGTIGSVASSLLPARKSSVWSPLHEAVTSQHPALLQGLVSLGLDVNELDSNGCSPLILLCKSPSYDIAAEKMWNVLLGMDPNVNIVDAVGRSALSYAVTILNSPTRLDLCNALLDKGADVNSIDENSRTPLFYAVYNNHDQLFSSVKPDLTATVCKLLLDRGAHVDSIDSQGRTPLSYAIEREKVIRQEYRKPLPKRPGDLSRLLLDNGADLYKVDFDGRTPLDYARR